MSNILYLIYALLKGQKISKAIFIVFTSFKKLTLNSPSLVHELRLQEEGVGSQKHVNVVCERPLSITILLDRF